MIAPAGIICIHQTGRAASGPDGVPPVTARPAGDACVCARHGTDRAGCKSPCQVIAEPKARRRARASSRGGV